MELSVGHSCGRESVVTGGARHLSVKEGAAAETRTVSLHRDPAVEESSDGTHVLELGISIFRVQLECSGHHLRLQSIWVW